MMVVVVTSGSVEQILPFHPRDFTSHGKKNTKQNGVRLLLLIFSQPTSFLQCLCISFLLLGAGHNHYEMKGLNGHRRREKEDKKKERELFENSLHGKLALGYAALVIHTWCPTFQGSRVSADTLHFGCAFVCSSSPGFLFVATTSSSRA